MINVKSQKISKATMARFPLYLKALRNMQLEGKTNFLSSELSEVTGVLDTTIRRDFSFLTGKCNFLFPFFAGSIYCICVGLF